MSAQKLDPKRAALVVIDVQEGFRKAVPGFEQIANATAALVRGAKAVGVPIVITEQYPKGLGTTAPQIAEHLPEGVTPIEVDKTPEEGYHLTEDLVDHAITYLHTQKSIAPDKPFFMYFAPGATHAPHHVPKEWAD